MQTGRQLLNGLGLAGLTTEHLLAGKGYDSDAIVEQTAQQGMKAQIPPRKNRKEQRVYDKDIYKLRHLVENAFLHLKRWHCDAVRKKHRLIPGCRAYSLHCIVGFYLGTTLSRV